MPRLSVITPNNTQQTIVSQIGKMICLVIKRSIEDYFKLQ